MGLHGVLDNSEKYLMSVIDSSLDGIAVVDEEGRFEFGNDSFFNIIGWQKEEIIGQFFVKILPDDAREFCFKKWNNVQAGIAERFETKIVTGSGEIGYVEVAHTQTVIKGKKKIVSIVKNISENKKLESNLRESEARYRELFENASDPMYTLDVRGCFLSINNIGLEILGCTKEDVIGSHISRWLTSESYGIAQETLIKQVSGLPVEQPIILEIVCKNGERRWGEIRTRVIKNGDTITEIHGIARDITEKRRLEQKLKEYHEKLEKSYEELKEADKLKTEFISNITHELFTPLTAIKGFTELIYDRTLGEINPQQQKSLEAILRNSSRLIRLINELFDTAHLEKNTLGLDFRLVSIGDVLSKSIRDICLQAREKDISIIQDIQPLPEIRGDEERLTQVMVNLLANAIKFTPQKGTITIAAGDGKSDIKISIMDTGIGIPADKLTRIFDRFYQIDGSSSRKYGGVGIGLSICKSIIEKHRGSIRAESNGKGSTFIVVLPKPAQNNKESGSGDVQLRS